MEDSTQPLQVKSSGQLPSLLNPKLPISNAVFSLFSSLPKELRHLIWEQSLTCQRYLKVELCSVNETTGKLRRNGSHGNTLPVSEPYRLLFYRPPKPSALFTTSVESRASAQRFYRVVLPCFYVTETSSITDSLQISQQNAERNLQGTVLSYILPYRIRTRHKALIPGTLSLNPELDTLEIEGFPQFTNFANDVWNHDPRRIGLCNVAFVLRPWHLGCNFRLLPRYAISEDQLRAVIARLQSVTFMKYDVVGGASHTDPAPSELPLRNCCSLPVAGATGSFARQQDPRLIKHDLLNSIYFDLWRTSNVGYPYQRWMELVEKLRVTTPCLFKVAYTTHRKKSLISCESDAVVHMKSPSEGRKERRHRWKDPLQEPGRGHLKETTGHSNGAIETAIGFWTFPIQSQGQPSRVYKHSEDQPTSRPELCLFYL